MCKNVRTVNADELGRQDSTALKSTFGRMIIEDTGKLSKITKEMALKAANEITGADKVAKSIHVQFAVMTNPDILAPGIPQKTKDSNP